jgi:predicted RNA binding protein YcfA (HicA-like mRNA interferase family)
VKAVSAISPVSGQEALKALQKKGFRMRKGKGDHIVVDKPSDNVLPFVVPLKDELKPGTLHFIIKSSNDFKEDFERLI